MPKILVVGNEEYEFPIEGDLPGYGQNVTDWATAVTDALQTVQAPGDILPTTAAINNNVSSPAAINGFAFDTAEVLSFDAKYYVQRTTDTPAANLVESGSISGNYDGSNWNIIIGPRIKTAGISFDITSGGVVTYTSTNMTGSNYSGEIRFQAKVINDL